MNATDLVFKALAHPARRRMIALLSVSACSVKELTASFAMSQPAVSQHLRELKHARLVASERVGVEQRYRLQAAPLKKVHDWSSAFRPLFDPAGHAWNFVAAAEPIAASKPKRRPANGR